MNFKKSTFMRIRLPILIFLFTFSISLFAQTAPDFKITTTDNESIGLYANYLDEGKSVVIELFFVDCPPCRSFAPFMANLHTQMVERNIQVEFVSLSISGADTDENVNEFKREFKHDWPFAHYGGGSEEAAKPYQDGTFGQYFGTPTIAVIAPDGSVNYVKRIFNNEGYIDAVETAIIESQTAFNEVEEPATAIVSGGINTLKGEGLGGVTVNFSGAKDTTIITDANGSFQTGSLLADESYTVALEKNDDPANGVTTLDIIFISKHILGIDTFTTSQEYTAADVNKSGGVTTFDIVHMRQIILGVIDEFPNTTSWVFEPAEIQITSLADLGTLSFTAIKIGDLNNSAKPNALISTTDRERSDKLTLLIEDQAIEVGEHVNVALNTAELSKIQAFQFTLGFNPNALQMMDLEMGELSNYKRTNFNLINKEKGLISTSWDTREEQNGTRLFNLNFIAQQSGQLSDFIQINSHLTTATAYGWKSEALDINLAFTKKEQTSNTEAVLFPNPSATNTVYLEISTEVAKEVNLRLLGLSGRVLRTTAYSIEKGTQLISINTIDFPAGVYTIQLSHGTETVETMRFVKQ